MTAARGGAGDQGPAVPAALQRRQGGDQGVRDVRGRLHAHAGAAKPCSMAGKPLKPSTEPRLLVLHGMSIDPAFTSLTHSNLYCAVWDFFAYFAALHNLSVAISPTYCPQEPRDAMEIFTVCMPLIFDTILIDPKLLVAVRLSAASCLRNTSGQERRPFTHNGLPHAHMLFHMEKGIEQVLDHFQRVSFHAAMPTVGFAREVSISRLSSRCGGCWTRSVRTSTACRCCWTCRAPSPRCSSTTSSRRSWTPWRYAVVLRKSCPQLESNRPVQQQARHLGLPELLQCY